MSFKLRLVSLNVVRSSGLGLSWTEWQKQQLSLRGTFVSGTPRRLPQMLPQVVSQPQHSDWGWFPQNEMSWVPWYH